MTDAELLIECKKGLDISLDNASLDNVLTQKLRAVKVYMKNAGVSDSMLNSDLAIGCLVVGVTDLWNLKGGDVAFSPVFHVLLAQIAIKSTVT
ncbi:hypothetical protein [Paenibacillus oleatilyticus]|uniref:hypothetical protein n=1 Tax=Paenibacillus oleatilyticus TaxID=2594886 RepID=UPI001C20042E|nr:hypothetical protein [Paenibacillus oleatilyticus]MBU7320281.1 hypothetical protein [Paenibacillus oleatilyticus]